MVNKEELLDLLYLMLKARRVEECLLDVFATGKNTWVHPCRHWTGGSGRRSMFVLESG